MLAPYADRVRVVELDSLLPVHSDVDVLLYDAFGRERVTGPVEQVITDTDAKVVIYTWHLDPELVREALDKGAVGLPVQDARRARPGRRPREGARPARSWSATPSPRSPARPRSAPGTGPAATTA